MHIAERQGLVFIAGYVARKVSEEISCQICTALLHRGQTMDVQFTDDTRELYMYLMALSRGGLLVATDSLVLTLARCQYVFGQLTLHDEFLTSSNQLDELVSCATMQLSIEDDKLFDGHDLHHDYCLKAILRVFFSLSLNRFSRKLTLAAAKKKSRKLSIFC